jgi:hypothetical protein
MGIRFPFSHEGTQQVKTIRISSGRQHYRDIQVPENFEEGLAMLIEAMDPALDNSGGDATRNSIAGRVAFGLFGENAPNPTAALNFLLQKICERKGAGLG